MIRFGLDFERVRSYVSMTYVCSDGDDDDADDVSAMPEMLPKTRRDETRTRRRRRRERERDAKR